MKYIVKNEEPPEFREWKALANEDWQPSYDIMPSDVKKLVKKALMEEQGFICCYCERRLTDQDSHIEHFRPQSDLSVDPLDFSNLLCSCQNQVKKGEPRHCGNLKEDWFDTERIVSPFTPDCENRFAYAGDGTIRVAHDDDAGARQTIEKLGLDIAKLNSLREHAIEPFLDSDLSQEDFRQFVKGYLYDMQDGRLGEFWTTIHYLFDDVH